jgi:hypothetical protein
MSPWRMWVRRKGRCGGQADRVNIAGAGPRSTAAGCLGFDTDQPLPIRRGPTVSFTFDPAGMRS